MPDKLSTGASGVSLAGVAYLAFELLGTVEGDVAALQDKVAELEGLHANQCEVDATYFRTRAAAMLDAAEGAEDVAARYRALRDYLVSEGGQLSPADANRLSDKERQAQEFRSRAQIFETSAQTVCSQ